MTCFWKKPPGYYGLVFAVALALAIIYTWPAVTDPGRIIPGSFETEQNQNIWSLWWLKRALWDLHTNPYFTNHLFYPYGSDLYLYALEPFNGLLALPITLLFGPVVSFNFICLLGLALTGVTATALCYNASGSRVGALVGGYAITFGLIHFSFVALGQLEFIGLWPFLLYLTFLVKLTKVRPASDPKAKGLAQTFRGAGWCIAAASFSLLVASFTTLYYAAYAVIFTGLLFGFRAIQVRKLDWLRVSLARLGLAWLVFGAIFGLFALRVSAEAKDTNNLLKTPDQVILNESVAIHSYFTEFDGNSLLGQWLGLPRLDALNYTSYLGFSLMNFTLPGDLALVLMLVLPLIIGLGAVWGDLVESAIKREFQTKDAGTWLPGFGGLLDRIDSLILVGPLVYYFLRFIQ